MSRVSPGALEAMNAQLFRGRWFSSSDNEHSPMVCIIDDKLASQYWPGENPVGKTILMDEPKPGQQPPPTVIVGIIREIKNYGVDQPVLPEVFVPFAQRPGGGGSLVMNSAMDSGSVLGAMRSAAQSLDPDLPIYNLRTLDSFVAENTAPRRLFRSFTQPLRRAGAPACGHRHLRRHVLRRQPEAPGNRYSHRARCRNARRYPPGRETRCFACIFGAGNRTNRSPCSNAADCSISVRSQSE